MDYITIPVIIAVCYLIGEMFKIIVKNDDIKKRFIPVLLGLSGAIMGVAIYYISPEVLVGITNPIMALAVGIFSGLASIGGNQMVKQLSKE